MITAQHLVKHYGPTKAVDDISFEIEPGQIVGFLGPNGAGKTTTLRILTGYLPPTAGAAFINGHNVLTDSESARQSIGYLPESTPLYTEMRVEEYLHFHGKLYGMPRTQRIARINTCLAQCGLEPVRRRLIGNLSKGNKQRVGIAQALLHEPPVLILDEPTAGLDPTQVLLFRDLMASLHGKHTIILSSHILPEVERSADRVIIVAGGKLVADGTPKELRAKASQGARILVEAKARPDRVASILKTIDKVASVDETESIENWTRAVATPQGNADIREAIAAAFAGEGVAIRELRNEVATLERFFVESTNEKVALEIVGGLGSDTFNVGDSHGKEVVVVSNDLKGHSGLFVQTVSSDDPDYQGIFVRDISASIAEDSTK